MTETVPCVDFDTQVDTDVVLEELQAPTAQQETNPLHAQIWRWVKGSLALRRQSANTGRQAPPRTMRADNLPPYVKVTSAEGNGIVLEHMSRNPHTDQAVQSAHPFSPSSVVGYFEVTVLNVADSGVVTIGLGEKDYPDGQQPGWGKGSYGYHGDDGRKFHDSTYGTPYSSSYGKGDVIGAGYNFLTHEVFFTRNGVDLGIAYTDVYAELYPLVGLDDSSASVNLGSHPFTFDIASYIEHHKQAFFSKPAESAPIPTSSVHDMVCCYLAQSGYVNTLRQVASVDDVQANRGYVAHLSVREQLRELLLEKDDVPAVLQLVKETFPGLLDGHGETHLLLHCHHFVNLVRNKDVLAALEYCRTALSSFADVVPNADKQIQRVVGLLAYVEPNDSPLAELLSQKSKERVWQALNTSILEANSIRGTPALERLVKQLVAVYSSFLDVPKNSSTRRNVRL